MTRRKVTGCEIGPGGTVYGVFGPSFGYRSRDEVISDIQHGVHEYYVREAPHETQIRVVDGGLLSSTSDVLSRNNLNNLPRR